MRIAFVHDRPNMAFPHLGVGRAGGTESTLYYIARELAAHHEVICIADTPSRSEGGVRFIRTSEALNQEPQTVDVVVVVDGTRTRDLVERLFASGHVLVFWLHNAPGSALTDAVTRPNIAKAEVVVCVSHWQAAGMAARLHLPSDRVSVIPNCVAPQFLDLFPSGTSILAQKTAFSLAYTSNPIRGLMHVPDLFTRVQQRLPKATLKVFGSFYLSPAIFSKGDLASYSNLFKVLQQTNGISLEENQSKDALSQSLRGTTALFYPTAFEETCCIAALEAMAAGCLIIATQAGALPETVAHFSRLAPTVKGGFSANAFIHTAIETLRQISDTPANVESLLRTQVDHVNRYYSPKSRAGNWEGVLSKAIAQKKAPYDRRSQHRD